MDARCYVCGGPAGSLEHIIPAALGGVLSSRALLCAQHNSGLGHSVDAELCRQLAPLANMIGLAPKAGTPPVRVRVRNPENPAEEVEYLRSPDGTLHRAQPLIAVTEVDRVATIRVEAASMKHLRQVLRGKKRKYPQLDVEGFLAGVATRTEPHVGPVKFSLEGLGGDLFFRAIAKIAVGFAVHRGIEARWVSDALECVAGTRSSERCAWPAYDVESIARAREGCHVVVVLGDPASGALQAYVELFGFVRCLVELSTRYAGPRVEASYGYDLTSHEEFEPRLSNWPTVTGSGGWDTEAIRTALQAYCRFAERASLIHSCVQAAFSACGSPGDEIPVKMLVAEFLKQLETQARIRIPSPALRSSSRIGRDPCVCGSGRLARACCGRRHA